jgi:hypothetical protein
MYDGHGSFPSSPAMLAVVIWILAGDAAKWAWRKATLRPSRK